MEKQRVSQSNEMPRGGLLSLFFTMMKIGLFTFGGGLAMIALLENEFVSKRAWLEREEFLDMVAIAESTPGPIAINAATYVGYKTRGFLGALLATLGICIPSFVVIYLISLFFDAFLSLRIVACAFRGIQVCVIYLILCAGLKMLKQSKKTPLSVSIIGCVLAAMLCCSLLAVRFSVIFYILICGGIGLCAYALRTLLQHKGAQK
jgi:chromate transporter